MKNELRLGDVFILGPAMLYASRKLTGVEKLFMIGIGVATILFNARNYEIIKNSPTQGD